MVCHVKIVIGSEAYKVAVIEIVALGGETEPLVNVGGSMDRLNEISGGLGIFSDMLQVLRTV
jgi:hypothetical protein